MKLAKEKKCLTTLLLVNLSAQLYGLPDFHYILGFNEQQLWVYSVYKFYILCLKGFLFEIVEICLSTKSRLVLCFI